MTAGMTLSEADATLARLRADGEAINAAMLDLESHPGHRFLTAASLTGQTRQRWQQASSDIEQLWAKVAEYRCVLDRAQQVRERKNRPGPTELAELAELLRGQAVVLSSHDVPLAQRGLTGPATVVNRASLAGLVDDMATSYQAVAELVTIVGQVVDAWASPLDELASTLAEAQTRAGELGLPEAGHHAVTALEAVDAELGALRELAFTNPLALPDQPAAARIRALTTKLDAARGQLDAIAAFRAGLHNQLRRADAAIDEVKAGQQRAWQARRTLLANIAVSGLPTLPDAEPALRARRAGLTLLANSKQWAAATDALADLDRAIAEAASQADTALDTATALLGRRDELRGRLDAYRAKAARLGLAEDPDLTLAHQRAKELLRAAPCDLAAATRALAGYQRLITDKESNR
jgi:hypothetical protein